MTHLDNAPPTNGQIAGVALAGVLVLLFAAVMFAALLAVLRRERAREDA